MLSHTDADVQDRLGVLTGRGRGGKGVQLGRTGDTKLSSIASSCLWV